MSEDDCTELEWVIDDTMLPPPSNPKGLCILCDVPVPQNTPKVPIKATAPENTPKSSPPANESPSEPVPKEFTLPLLGDIYEWLKNPSLIQFPPERRSVPDARRLEG